VTGVRTAAARVKRRAAPLIAVDGYEVLSATEITATKVVKADDPYLEGHYPDFTIYPGVFIIESVVQTVRLLAGETMEMPEELELVGVPSVRFVTPMLPGDVLHIRVQTVSAADGTVKVKAECQNADGAKAAQMKLEFRPVAGTAAAVVTSAPAGAPAAQATRSAVPVYDHAALRGLLPHRHPIIMVDRVEEIVPFESIVATKAVTGSEPCYAGIAESDSPRRYAYPRSLIIESFGQSGAVLWLESIRREGRTLDGSLIFAAARDVTFHREAYPGDVLRHEAWLDQIVGDNAFLRGRTLIDGEPAVEYGSCIAVMRKTDSLGSETD
jgi:3-hydroxymyristoyl/3-hydroxydecanoyl-(acyl carrier protein) dehydratase